jgi:hypothetical protein
MSQDKNVCSNLEIENFYPETNEHLKELLNMQADIQQGTYGTKYTEMTLEEIKNFWLVNNHALVDELHEMMDALGGVHDGIGNAVWKFWKGKNKLASKMKIKDLSERDLLELKFEIVDMLHFFLNYAGSIGMTAEEMYNMYMAKNKENRRRQKEGY